MNYLTSSWKNGVLLACGILSLIYAIPNVFIDQPILQITHNAQSAEKLSQDELQTKITQILKAHQLPITYYSKKDSSVTLGFQEVDTQLTAQEKLTQALGDAYNVLVNLKPTTPKWLQSLGAQPMRLGLDLKGGIHLVLALDTTQQKEAQLKKWLTTLTKKLSEAKIPYLAALTNEQSITLTFKQQEAQQNAHTQLLSDFPDLLIRTETLKEKYALTILLEQKLLDIKRQVMIGTLRTLHNRVNELGIKEHVIYPQGENHIVVDLLGIQDMAHAQRILESTATIAFHLVQDEPSEKNLPLKRYSYQNQSIALELQTILTGDAIIDAKSGFNLKGQPCINIKLNKKVERYLHDITRQNIGKQMAVVYQERQNITHSQKEAPFFIIQERVISVARISSALGRHFQITGLSKEDAEDLALLLRAKSLPVPIYRVAQTTIGPQLGLENIRLSINTIIISFLVAALFMGFYYRQFGWIANFSLLIHLSLLTASLSILGMTLTLAGIAGILLSSALAVDAQVLTFERIRQARRKQLSAHASIQVGYEKVYTTLLDTSITLLIIVCILFILGSEVMRGFAVTLGLGILTSMLSTLGFSRALIDYFYPKHIRKLPVE